MTTNPSPPIHVPVDLQWDAPVRTSRTTLTTHAWTAPPLRPTSPIHDRAFEALRDLKADYARFLPFWTHPHLSIPALHPPTETETSWDFSLLDPFVTDFMAAAQGRPVVANFAAMPLWLFEPGESVDIGTDPDAVQWTYLPGTTPRDESMAEIADYFERQARWYIEGGFTDELGNRHTSGHDYRFEFWEVLCEPEVGYELDPLRYTQLYDALVTRLRRIDPEMRFVGLSLSGAIKNPDYFWHFLDPANHAPGIPLDAISHHWYATPPLVNVLGSEGNDPFEVWPAMFFAQADGFLHEVELIDSIKARLSPDTEFHVNEIGTFAADVMAAEPDIPDDYWTLGGAVVAYVWSRLTAMGIDLVGVAEFVGYAGVIPAVSLVDWETGEPNARYRVLKLLLEHFGPGDELVTTKAGGPTSTEPPVHAQGFRTAGGQRKVLLVNTRATAAEVELADVDARVELQVVDTSTGSGEPRSARVNGPVIDLGPFATAVVTLD